MSNKSYHYFISYICDQGSGSIHPLLFTQKITSKNIKESMLVIKEYIEKTSNVTSVVIQNFILLDD